MEFLHDAFKFCGMRRISLFNFLSKYVSVADLTVFDLICET